MIVGIPTEVKDNEFRVAATPEGVRELMHAGHAVVVAVRGRRRLGAPRRRLTCGGRRGPAGRRRGVRRART